jgi:hypothetical protein
MSHIYKGDVPQDRYSSRTRLPERSVPHRKHRVSQAQDVPQDALIRLVKEVRLAALRVDMRMRTEEWRERTNDIPPHEHLRLWIAEEPTHVSCKRV